jgi:tetratricopeptide (TPR) repeat protein
MSQTQADLNPDSPEESEEQYRAFVRALKRRRGFGLLFVRCSPAQGERLIARVRKDIPQKTIDVLSLDEAIDNLYEIIDSLQNKDQIDILFIKGLENSLINYIKPGIGGQGDYYKEDTVPRILGHLNLQRERFRDNFKFCFVFLLPLYALKYFIRRAPDFFDWRSGVFEFPTDLDFMQGLSSILSQADNEKNKQLTHQERKQRLLTIQALLEENHQTLEEKADLLCEQGNLFWISKEYEEAIASYDQALKLKPGFHKALLIKPLVAEFFHEQGLRQSETGDYESAIANFERALQYQPDHYEAWNDRGVTLSNLGRYQDAIASYEQALYYQGDFSEAWYNRGVALADLGRYEEAIASYDQALYYEGDFYEAWYNRGLALDKLGQYEAAITSYEQTLHHQADFYPAWYNQGNVFRKLGRLEQAITSYTQALELEPEDCEAWYNKACCYALQGNLVQALENLKQAIQLDSHRYRTLARTDSDFDSIRQDERFQALIDS